jgi:hypothetical protein
MLWYSKLFEGYNDSKIAGEIGATYFESMTALENIKLHNPNIKIIILVRNPVERTFSSYTHEFIKGRVNSGFFDAIKQQPRIINSGKYSVLIPNWEGVFGKENIYYLLQEEIQENPQQTLDNLCYFLNIDSFRLPEELTGKYGQRTMPRNRLLAFVFSSIARYLRTIGLYRIVEMGKKIGLKRVFVGGKSSELKMSSDHFEFLLKTHENDIKFLENKFNRDFSFWRDKASLDGS